MARCGLLADGAANRLLQRLGERDTLSQHHKQDDPHIIFPCLPNTEAINDLGQFFNLAINLSCANSHTAWV